MQPTKGTGEHAPARQEGTASATKAAGEENASQTLACRDCNQTNIRRIQGNTGVGRRPTADGPYACNDCGYHGKPRARPKQATGSGRRGLAGTLADADAEDLVTDGGGDA